MVVATVDNATGHLWILQIPLATEIGTWTDVSGSTGPALNVNAAVEVNTDNNSGNADVWGVSSTGSLEQYRMSTGVWTDHGAPATGVLVTAEGVASHFVSSSQYNVFVIGSDLTLRVRYFNGTTWSWGNPLQPPGDFVSGGRNSLAYPTPLSGMSAVFLVGGIDGKLWTCAYAPSTASCRWVSRNHAPDNQGSTAWGLSVDLSLSPRRYRLLLNATINTDPLVYSGVTYVNAYNLVTNQWENHLAPVDSIATTLTNPGDLGEYSVDEFFGTVILTGIRSDESDTAFYRSTDDGNSWSAPTYPMSPSGTDVEVSFDAAGTAYATNRSGQIIASGDFGNSWSAVYSIPTSDAGDRTSMVADWRVAGRVYYEEGVPPGPTHFMYCTSGVHCADSTGTWCGPYPFPTNSRAFISLAGDGALYFVTDVPQFDSACPPVPGYNGAAAVRRIPNVAALPASCAAPTWTAAECLYFYRDDEYGHPPSSTRNGGYSPGIAVNIDAPRDNRSGPMVLLRGYTDTMGAVCSPTSVHCRADVYAAWRSSAGSWSATTQAAMLRVNQDPITGWVDHILGVPLALDYSRFNVSWMDWREDPTSDSLYHLYSATMTTAPTVTETQWPVAASWWGYFSDAWPGDIHRGANARLHGHQVGSLGSLMPPASSVVGTAIVSPYVR
jgi:hypothetical protein